MKTLILSIIVFLLVIILFPFNTVLAQNETQPQIQFDHVNFFTEKMSCNFYNTGKISAQDQAPKKATIIVTDPDANKFSTSIDRVTVNVWSDSDKKGIEITAYETAVNSGIFKGTVTISEGQSTQDTIHVSDGDTLWARYASTTPWSLDTTNHGVITTAFVGASCPPLERVSVSGIQVVDKEGNEQKIILAGKQIQIRSELANPTIRNQTFAYIVQIWDKDKITESFSWLSGMLLPSQRFSPGVSWTPYKAGNYTVNVFAWQSINNPNALSPPISTDLAVWPSLSAYTRSTIRNSENLQCQSGYELVIKSSNNSPACVKPQTAQKLVERGWATTLHGVDAFGKPPIGLYNVTISPQPVISGMPFFVDAIVVNHQTNPITYYGGCAFPLSVSFHNSVIANPYNAIHCLALSTNVLGPNETATVHTDKLVILSDATGAVVVDGQIKFSYVSDGQPSSVYTGKEFVIQPSQTIPEIQVSNQANNVVNKASNVLATVDSNGTAGIIAIGSDGLPVISYLDYGTSPSLKVAHCGDLECSKNNTITHVDYNAEAISITIGKDGLPVIVYRDDTSGDLKVAKCGNLVCSAGNTITIVDANSVTESTSITIGDDGFPLISYDSNVYDTMKGPLKVLKCGNTSCSAGNIITYLDQYSGSNSIAVGADGLPVIGYTGPHFYSLNLLKCGNLSCSAGNAISVVYTWPHNSQGQQYPSIKMGSDNLPLISSIGPKVTHCTDPFCYSNLLSWIDVNGTDSSLAVGRDGLPIISYFDTFYGHLKVAHCGNVSCSANNDVRTIDSSGSDVGHNTSIAIGSDGLPIIIYWDRTSGYLKVAHCASVTC